MAIAAGAGFVDAMAFVQLGGFFVSFMSGNSTRLGVGLVLDAGAAWLAGGLIAAFVAGVVAGSLTSRATRRNRRPAVLMLVAGILVSAAILASFAEGRPAALLLAAAMGAVNAAFEQDGESRFGLTYMTGALVKAGQRIAGALTGGDRWSWLPYAALWLGLVAGACGGVLAHAALGINAIWIAAGLFAALASVTLVVRSLA